MRWILLWGYKDWWHKGVHVFTSEPSVADLQKVVEDKIKEEVPGNLSSLKKGERVHAGKGTWMVLVDVDC